MGLSNFTIRPGFYTDETERGSEPYWRDGDHVRFRNGIPEKIGGWRALLYNSGYPITVSGYARNIHDWASLDGQSWVAIGTHKKLYLVNGQRLHDITPIRDNGTLSNPFATTAGSTTVTVMHVSHNENAGDYVHFSGADAVGGLTIDGEYQISTIIDIDKYTIEATNPAATTDSGGGTVDYKYEIHIGHVSRTKLYGYGIGGYGKGTYGTPRAESSLYSRLRIWSLSNWGEDLIASPVGGAIYTWNRTLGPSVRAHRIAGSPDMNQWVMVSAEDRHLIGLGSSHGGQKDAMQVRWSDQENYNDWMPAETNTAGAKRLDQGSRIITAVLTRGEKVIFTDEALYSMQFIGPPFVFGFGTLGQSITIVSPNAAVHVNGMVLFMATDDFFIYEGVINVLGCPVRNHVFDDLNTAHSDKVYATVNRLFTEVTWYYPSKNSSENDKYVTFNYHERLWYFGTMDRTAMHDQSASYSLPYGVGHNGTVYIHETGVDANGQALPSYLESYDFDIGDGNYFGHVNRMFPDFLKLNGSIDLSLVSQHYPQSPPRIDGPFPVTADTERVSLRTRNREIALRVETSDLGDDWRMGTWRAEVRKHGRR